MKGEETQDEGKTDIKKTKKTTYSFTLLVKLLYWLVLKSVQTCPFYLVLNYLSKWVQLSTIIYFYLQFGDQNTVLVRKWWYVVWDCVFQPGFWCCTLTKAGWNSFLAIFRLFSPFQMFKKITSFLYFPTEKKKKGAKEVF